MAQHRPSGLEPQFFDPKVAVKDDVYRAVNGKWLDQTRIPDDRDSWGTWDILGDAIDDDLHAVIDANAGGEASAQPTPIGRVERLYASFMDTQQIEQLGAAPLLPLLSRIDRIDSRQALIAAFAELDRSGCRTPVAINIHQDNHDATRAVVDLEQDGLGLPDRDYYLQSKDQHFAEVRSKYVAYIRDLLSRAGDAQAAREAPRILAFETALARISWDRVALRDPVRVYHRVPLTRLPALAPSIDWTVFAEHAGYAGRVDYVIVGEPSYLRALSHLLATTPLEDVRAYLKLSTVAHFAPYLSQPFVALDFAFNRTELGGVPANLPRWKRAIHLVNAYDGEDLGQSYVARHFPPQAKARARQLVDNLLAAYHQSIQSVDWLGPKTRAAAEAKLDLLDVKIGYPDKWRDYSKLEIKADDLVGNVLRAEAFEFQRNLDKLGQPIDRTEWELNPQTLNAYFEAERNEIVFPAAILQAPLFDADADMAASYGAIGAIIGHEISHGFDDEGSQFDGLGNLHDWWTPADHRAFVAKTKRLVAQYSAFEPVPGYHVNGALTLGENIADNSGLAIAYKAYEISLQGQPSPVIDGLTGEQRFYYGYAQAWRGKMREAQQILELKSDPHSPDPVRPRAAVRNQPGFYQAFGVKPGDGEYLPPDQRVVMW